MAGDTLTLELEGDVSLSDFASAMGHFFKLVQALTREVAGKEEIEWEIAHLKSGSAVATVRGQASDIDAVARVVNAYEAVGQALEGQHPIPYSYDVVEPANELTGLINGRIKSINLRTSNVSAAITEAVGEEKTGTEKLRSIGAITGAVQTISSRNRYKFTLYDSLFDHAVTCFLSPEQSEKMRDIWGKQVTVIGKIYRDPYNGKPLEIRQIVKITVEEQPKTGDYRRARGVFSWKPGDPPAEKIIRELWDD